MSWMGGRGRREGGGGAELWWQLWDAALDLTDCGPTSTSTSSTEKRGNTSSRSLFKPFVRVCSHTMHVQRLHNLEKISPVAKTIH